MNNDYDLIIVGGGMVGASLAIALSGHGLQIALIEAAVPGESQPSYDDRAIALAYGSHRICRALGIWPAIAPNASAIRKIHVSERGGFGFTRLNAADQGLEAMGYVVTARDLGVQLLAALHKCTDVTFIAPARVSRLINQNQSVQVHLQQDNSEKTLSASLLVAADGGSSFIRESLGIKTRRWEYGQSAVTANITPSQPHHGQAYERFTEQGPIALLPMAEDRCALVWTVDNEQLEEVLAYDDETFLREFQRRFGWRLGRFTRVGKRSGYPLSHIRARESVRPRVAIIGNAAHTLHPIAGQGFNLGIRDVAALAEVVVQAHKAAQDIGSRAVLTEYDQWRRRDQQLVAMSTDGLARVFSNPLLPLRIGRNLAMLAIDSLPAAKRRLTRAAMGLQGRLPRLARGLPLE